MKKHHKVKLSIWKVYLYTLAQRWRRYKWINMGMADFGLTNKEKGILHGMQHKYLRKEVLRCVKAVQYFELVKIVLGSKLAIATREEIEVANKLFLAYQINTGELIMELKQLKAFAKEVGLSEKQIKGLDEDELTLEILKNIDAEKTYSDDFVEWYEDLPETVFDEADAIDDDDEKPAKGKKGKKDKEEEAEEETDFSELREAIEEATEIDELVELAQDEDYEEIFEDVDTDTKLVKKLKKTMLAAIDDYEEALAEEKKKTAKGKKEKVEEKPAKGKKAKEEVEEEKSVKGKKDKAEKEAPKAKGKKAKEEEPEEVNDYSDLAEAINEADDAEGLKEVADSVKEDNPELFKGISFRSGRGKSPYRTDIKKLKKEMLERLAIDEEPEEEVEEETAELDITEEAVNDAVEAEDKETLKEMCTTLNIKLSILEKKSIDKMAEKILAVLPKESKKKGKEEKGKKEKAKGIDKGEESKSLFQIVEEMVEAEEDESDIVKAVTPILTERGKNKFEIKKLVKQMVAVVEAAME